MLRSRLAACTSLFPRAALVLAVFVGAGLSVLNAADCQAKVILKQLPNKYVIIRGRTGTDIGHSLHDNRIGYRKGEHALAMTFADLDWKWKYQRVVGGYVIRDVVITLQIQYLYPRWVSRNYAQPGVAEKWDRYLSMLIIHEEKGHGQIHVEMARELEKVLLSMPAQKTTEAVNAYAQKASELVLKKHDQRHEEFDQKDDSARYVYVLFPSKGTVRDITAEQRSPADGKGVQ